MRLHLNIYGDGSTNNLGTELNVYITRVPLEQLGKTKRNSMNRKSAETFSWCAKATDYLDLHCEGARSMKSGWKRYRREIAYRVETSTAVGDFGKLF